MAENAENFNERGRCLPNSRYLIGQRSVFAANFEKIPRFFDKRKNIVFSDFLPQSLPKLSPQKGRLNMLGFPRCSIVDEDSAGMYNCLVYKVRHFLLPTKNTAQSSGAKVSKKCRVLVG